ncbi:MAG: hypothetical protein O8C66_04285 [Candidatus Methanoperedens sp.]|nr:hypothetical protein [Candidatus Methanoperedens sp.]
MVSIGNENSENGKSIAEKLGSFARKKFMNDFRHGEGFTHKY